MRIHSFLAVLMVAMVAAGACTSPTPVPPPTSAVQEADESSISVEELMNMTYTLPDGGEITLRDGMYQERPAPDSATFISNFSLSWDLSAFGDLTGDAHDDAAVILVDAPGGSGTFVYLAAVTEEAGIPVNVSTELLGDRVDIEDHVIEGLESRLTVIAHGPDDPMCCPTERHVWGYSLKDDQLVQSSDELVIVTE